MIRRYIATAALLSLALPASAGTIVGSAHDFSTSAWSGGEICVACHTPHFADQTVAGAPLWNHTLTTATFTLYSSATLDATLGQPDGVSKLCLSCHDGTVALGSFGGNTDTSFIPAAARLGTDISDDHPISFAYDAALVTADGELVALGSTNPNVTGLTVQPDDLLLGGKVECASCHDVHNTSAVAAPLLRVQKTGSRLCMTCHQK